MSREAASKNLVEPEGVNAGPPVSGAGEDQPATVANSANASNPVRPDPSGVPPAPTSEVPTGGDNGELLSSPEETRTRRPPQPGQQAEVGEG